MRTARFFAIVVHQVACTTNTVFFLFFFMHWWIAVVLQMECYTSPLIWQPLPTLSSSMRSHTMHNWIAWVGVVDRHGQSKSTICSPYGPYQALWSKGSSLFCHIRHCDCIGHSLRHLEVKIWRFLCGRRRWWHDQLLYPLCMHTG